MNKKTMDDVLADDLVKFIELPSFLKALQFYQQNKKLNTTTRIIFYNLLDKGLKLHFSKPGYVDEGVNIPNADVKCALNRIDEALLETEIPKERDKLFSQEIIKTESGFKIILSDILIGRDNVQHLYSQMGCDSYPWVKVPLAYDASECIEYFIKKSVSQHSDFNKKYKKRFGGSFWDDSETDEEFEIAFDVYSNPSLNEIGISDTRLKKIMDKKISPDASSMEKQNAIAELASLRPCAVEEYKRIPNDILVNPLPVMSENLSREDRVMLFVWLHTLEGETIKVNKSEWSKEQDKKFEQIYKKIAEITQQLGLRDNQITSIELATKDSQADESNKPRRRLQPLIRETNECLLLIYALVREKNVTYLDQMPGPKAWGLITSGEFKSSLIKSLPETKNGYIELNGGEKYNRSEFYEKYRKRFKPE